MNTHVELLRPTRGEGWRERANELLEQVHLSAELTARSPSRRSNREPADAPPRRARRRPRRGVLDTASGVEVDIARAG